MRCEALAGTLLGMLLIAPGMCADAEEVTLLEHFEEKSEAIPGLRCSVLRFELDITGDQVPELFLAQTQTVGSSGLQMWFVYSRLQGEQYRFVGALGFSHLLFRVLDDPARLVTYYDTQRGSGAMVTFRVDAGGFVEESRQQGVVAGGPAWTEFASWRKAVGFKVLSSDLWALETDSDPEWTDLLTSERVLGIGNLPGVVVVE